MSLLTFDFIIKQSPRTKYSDAQIFLQEFTGKSFSYEEAEIVWTQILDHKWNMSERLNRDIGLKIAAIDFVENFYHPIKNTNKANFSNTLKTIGKGIRTYFEAKSKYSA